MKVLSTVLACTLLMPAVAVADELAKKADALRSVKYLYDEYFAEFEVENFQISEVVDDYEAFRVNELLCASSADIDIDAAVQTTMVGIRQIESFLNSYTSDEYNSGVTELNLKFRLEDGLSEGSCVDKQERFSVRVLEKIKLLQSLELEITKREADILKILQSN